MIQREFVLERWFVREVKRLGGRCLKMNQFSGIPDRLVLFPGEPPMFVELKAENGVLSRQQEVVIKQLRAEGHLVYVADSKEQINQILTRTAR